MYVPVGTKHYMINPKKYVRKDTSTKYKIILVVFVWLVCIGLYIVHEISSNMVVVTPPVEAKITPVLDLNYQAVGNTSNLFAKK